MIIGLIGAIIIILTVYLSGQYGGDHSIPRDNLNIAGDTQGSSIKEEPNSDHLARIADLETELEDKQRR